MEVSRKTDNDALEEFRRPEDFGELEYRDERLSIIWVILASVALWASFYALYELVR